MARTKMTNFERCVAESLREPETPVMDGEVYRPKFIGAYAVERCYGGPEEGGWWYDQYEHLKSVPYPDGEGPVHRVTLNAVLEELLKEHADYDDGRSLGSMASTGALRIIGEDKPGDRVNSRPSYE